jgi:hypothetical protein
MVNTASMISNPLIVIAHKKSKIFVFHAKTMLNQTFCVANELKS